MGEHEVYDVIVIGGGPAGLTSSIYTSSARRSTLLIEKDEVGGLMLWTSMIENYPGFPTPMDARELAERMRMQAERFGAKIIRAEVSKVEEEADGTKRVITTEGEFRGKSLIIASGMRPRKLGVKGEELPGASYCAVCDGPLYEGMDVFIVGSGDSAITDALFMSKIASKVSVIVIHEKPKLDAKEYLREQAFKTENIEFVWNSLVEEILGEGAVAGVRVRNLKTGEVHELSGSAVFIKIGLIPNTDFLKGFVSLTKEGFVEVVEEGWLKTLREGVFVAGDVREKIQRQIATAVGDGCCAAEAAIRYLEEREYLDRMLLEERLVVSSFWDSSDPSTSQRALLSRLTEELGEKVSIFEVDLYRREGIRRRFGIEEVPTILLMRKGKALDGMKGKIGFDELIGRVRALLGG